MHEVSLIYFQNCSMSHKQLYTLIQPFSSWWDSVFPTVFSPNYYSNVVNTLTKHVDRAWDLHRSLGAGLCDWEEAGSLFSLAGATPIPWSAQHVFHADSGN